MMTSYSLVYDPDLNEWIETLEHKRKKIQEERKHLGKPDYSKLGQHNGPKQNTTGSTQTHNGDDNNNNDNNNDDDDNDVRSSDAQTSARDKNKAKENGEEGDGEDLDPDIITDLVPSMIEGVWINKENLIDNRKKSAHGAHRVQVKKSFFFL